jgi:putative membrane protein insertion efficiency factor
MKNIALLLIKFYQYAISPYVPPACRFYPTCSSYAYEAVVKYGFLRGSFLAVKRLLRCHPFCAGGYDPVP